MRKRNSHLTNHFLRKFLIEKYSRIEACTPHKQIDLELTESRSCEGVIVDLSQDGIPDIVFRIFANHSMHHDLGMILKGRNLQVVSEDPETRKGLPLWIVGRRLVFRILGIRHVDLLLI